MENEARLRLSDLPLPIVGIASGACGLFSSIFIARLLLLFFPAVRWKINVNENIIYLPCQACLMKIEREFNAYTPAL